MRLPLETTTGAFSDSWPVMLNARIIDAWALVIVIVCAWKRLCQVLRLEGDDPVTDA